MNIRVLFLGIVCLFCFLRCGDDSSDNDTTPDTNVRQGEEQSENPSQDQKDNSANPDPGGGNTITEDNENPDFEEVPNRNIASLSDCSLSNNVLFDAPVHNTIVETDRTAFGMGTWKLVDELSDEFDYAAGKTASVFLDKWKLGFVNNYTGPVPTFWTGNQISFETLEGSNRAVVLQAKEVGSGSARRLHCGMMSTKAKSSYPLFQEARVKISNSQLANAVWMLSSDSGTTEEIDNVEAYGPRIRVDGMECDQAFYADRIHLSHHTFSQNSNGSRLDYQPKKDTWMSRKKTEGDCNRSNDVVWSQEYHIFGVSWKSPTRLEYYVDGALVKVVDGLRISDGIDPLSYTKCDDGLTREMHMLISHAAQTWRYGSGQTGVDAFWNSNDVKTGANTKMFVDWIRVYSPTGSLNSYSCN